MRWSLLLGLLFAAPAPAQGLGTRARTWRLLRIPSAGLAFELPADFKERPAPAEPGRPAGRYDGLLGGAEVSLRWRYDSERFETVSRTLLELDLDGRLLSVSARLLGGEPAALYRREDASGRGERRGLTVCPHRRAFVLELRLPEAPGKALEAEAARLLGSLRRLPPGEYTLAAPTPRRLNRTERALGFPGIPEEKVRFLASPHYRLWTTAGAPGARRLLRFLEEEVLPWIEPRLGSIEGRGPLEGMTIFLHRTRGGYLAAALRSGLPREQAEAMDGHAWHRFYRTWYAAPRDPIHAHEATHQLMAAVYGLDGGGPWLQEGLAQWVEAAFDRTDLRRAARNILKRTKGSALDRLFDAETFLHRGGGETPELYRLAGSLLAFLAEGGAKRLRAFVLHCGVLPFARRDLLAAAIQAALDQRPAELEAAWRAWALAKER